jgi:hypothetical protein
MKIEWGAIVTDGRGKLGGHVASKNRAGAYFRTKVTPVNPSTVAQLGARSRFASLSSAWRGLTTAQRSTWIANVANYAKTNIFGQLKNPSGSNLYQRLNNNLLVIGESALSDCPPIGAVATMSSFSFAVSEGGGTILLTFAPVIPATIKFKVFATPGMSPGINFVKSEFRLISVLDNTDLTGLDIATEWSAVFGSVPPEGQKMFFKLVPVLVASGLEGNAISAEAIVAA